MAIITLLIMVAGASIIVRPRLWVKNKTAKVVIDGRLSENVNLFHGSDGRLLFYLRGDPAVYYYSDKTGVLACDAQIFINVKVIAFSAHARPACPALAATATIREQSLQFIQAGRDVTVSWQPAPR